MGEVGSYLRIGYPTSSVPHLRRRDEERVEDHFVGFYVNISYPGVLAP